jgi:hypothetical protein
MLRDMAAGIVALKTALEDGHTVNISGPVASLEIDSRALADAAQWPEILRRAQVVGPPRPKNARRDADRGPARVEPSDDDRVRDELGPGDDDVPRSDWDHVREELDAGEDDYLDKLRADEDALAPPPPTKRNNTWFALAFIPTFLVILLPALATRLVTWPVRSVIRDRKERHADRRRERSQQAILDATEALRANPDDVDLRNDRALRLLESGWRVAADREFVACLDRLAAGVTATVRPAVLHYNLYVAREHMGLPTLAKRSLDAAKAAGLETRRPSWLRRVWGSITTFGIAMIAMFIAIAGLDPD